MRLIARPRTAVFTDPLAPEIDQAQYDTGEGPCLAAFEQQKVFGIESTSEDGPWRAFRRTAAEHGIRSTLSLPMAVLDKAVGAMNLYSRQERAFDHDAVDRGSQFVSQAAAVLLNANAYWDARALNRLGEAMEHRGDIEQAKGMLMSAQRCTSDEAFQILVRACIPRSATDHQPRPTRRISHKQHKHQPNSKIRGGRHTTG